MSNLWMFVIDTNSYSGNFEREMCAYLTGRTGECGKGKDFAALFFEDMGIDNSIEHFANDYIIDQPDEHGCHRPVTIHPTPGFFNDGFGDEYPDSILDTPEGRKKTVDKYVAKCQKEIKQQEKQKYPSPVDHWYKSIENAKKNGVSQYPSYQSVAIYMERPPTEEEVTVLIERANKFNEADKTINKYHEPIKVLGFRLIKEATTESTEKSWPVA